MLRNAVVALGAACLIGGGLALVSGVWPSAFGMVLFGALLLLGTIWERVRYKPIEAHPPGPAFVATDERFVDDEMGRPVRVYAEARTGERRYVQE